MTSPAIAPGVLRQYLLGQLSAQARERVEDSYFDDDAVFGTIVGIEDQLIEDYFGSRLSEQERQLFEQAYLTTPEGRERVRPPKTKPRATSREQDESIQSFASHTRPVAARAPKRYFVLTSAAMALLVIASVALFVENRRVRSQVVGLSASLQDVQQQERSARDQLAAERGRTEQLSRLEAAQPGDADRRMTAQRIVTLSLMPRLRDREVQARAVIPPGVTSVLLRLAVANPTDLNAFRVTLERQPGDVVSRLDVLKPRKLGAGELVDVPVPANLLTPGTYEMILEPLSPSRPGLVQSYSFQVRTP